MGDQVYIKVHGLEHLQSKLNITMIAKPAKRLVERWGLWTSSRAAEYAPINEGQLRGSLTYELQPGLFLPGAVAGTNIPHGPWMEGGTGLLADLPGGKGERHWPPAAALEDWAGRHGTTGAAVARAIGKRGGLVPRRFLRKAAEESEQKMDGWVMMMAREIELEAAE